jgi:pyruvate,water dikinase
LATTVVSGSVVPDTITVNKESGRVKDSQVGSKIYVDRICNSLSIERNKSRKEKREKLSLEKERVEKLYTSYNILEKLFKIPQDVEWCFVNEKLWILQSRPIT